MTDFSNIPQPAVDLTQFKTREERRQALCHLLTFVQGIGFSPILNWVNGQITINEPNDTVDITLGLPLEAVLRRDNLDLRKFPLAGTDEPIMLFLNMDGTSE